MRQMGHHLCPSGACQEAPSLLCILGEKTCCFLPEGGAAFHLSKASPHPTLIGGGGGCVPKAGPDPRAACISSAPSRG